MLDLIIKNGRIVDGTGLPAYMGDVGVLDGRIVQLGKVEGEAKTVVDASNKVVSPGFIDPHTHFDAQLLWDGQARPALEHGVTTIVPGNCSLSLAPLKEKHRPILVGMFNQIEEMPVRAFEEGIEWNWESFQEFLTRIKSTLAINIAPLVGHSVLRLWVMDEAAAQRVATKEEVQQMQDLLRECLECGAVGLSTSFVDMDERLQPVPSRFSDVAELDALCEVLGDFQRILQIVPEFYDVDLSIARLDQLADLSIKHQITTTFSPLFVNGEDTSGVDRLMRRVEEQFVRGARVWPQVQTRPIDISFTLDVPSLLFIRLPGWYATMRFGTHESILADFSDPSRRQAFLTEAQAGPMKGLWDILVIRQVQSDKNQCLVGRTLGEVAKERGCTSVELMLDLSVEENLQAHFLAADMGHNNVAKVGELLTHPNVHIGASDGGAHILSFSTYGDTGYLFSKFVREAGLMGVEAAVKKITSDTASIWGLSERGYLKKDFVADITIFDAGSIARGEEYYRQDIPGEGSRYVRDAIGVDTVIVGGEITYRAESGYTDACCGQILPGRAA